MISRFTRQFSQFILPTKRIYNPLRLYSTHKQQHHVEKAHHNESPSASSHHDHHQQHEHQINRDKIVLRNERSGYFMDPNSVARRIIRVISLYDTIGDITKIKLSTKWHELGIDEIDYSNIIVAIENEFDIEFPEEDIERFKDIEDTVKFVSKSFMAA